MIGKALRDGVTAKAPINFQYVKLLIEQQVGEAEQNITLDLAKKVIHELHPGPGKTAA